MKKKYIAPSYDVELFRTDSSVLTVSENPGTDVGFNSIDTYSDQYEF